MSNQKAFTAIFTAIFISLATVALLAAYKLSLQSKTIEALHLQIKLCETNTQELRSVLEHQNATIKKYEIDLQNLEIDKESLTKNLKERRKVTTKFITKILKQTPPKDCKESISYLKQKAFEVFDTW